MYTGKGMHVCIEDVVMEASKEVAFKKGNFYEFSGKCATNEQGNSGHMINSSKDGCADHFIYIGDAISKINMAKKLIKVGIEPFVNFATKTDYPLLAKQRKTLLYIVDEYDTPAIVEDIEGLISFINEFRDMIEDEYKIKI